MFSQYFKAALETHKSLSLQLPVPSSTPLLPTHGLVSGGYRSGMMQYQDLSLKLPSGLWADPRGNHHHALPDGRTLDLYKGVRIT